MKRVVFLIMLFFCFGLSCNENSNTEPFEDPIFCNGHNYLYDQSDLMRTDVFQQASRTEQETMLRALFENEKQAAYIKQIYGTWKVVLPLIIAGYLFRNQIRTIVNNGIGIGGGLGSLGGIALLAQSGGFDILGNAIKALSKTITQPFSKVSGTVFDFDQSPASAHSFQGYELQYVKMKPWIQRDFHNIIESKFKEMHCDKYLWEDRKKEFLRSLEIILSLPYEVKQLKFDYERISESLKGYSPKTRKELLRYCVRHVAASSSKSVRKIAAYFMGSPGIGKTRAVSMLAAVLDISFKSLSIGNVSIDDLVGTKEKPGKILEALVGAIHEGKKYKNILLLLDDADRILIDGKERLAFLLTLLEPETKTFYSPYLDVHVDISHLGIILAGNSPIQDEALKNRLHVIEFDGFSKDYKKEVVIREFLPSAIAPHKNAELALTEADFTSKDFDVIRALIDQDDDSGFRSIKLKLIQYVEDKVLQKYYSYELFDYNITEAAGGRHENKSL